MTTKTTMTTRKRNPGGGYCDKAGAVGWELRVTSSPELSLGSEADFPSWLGVWLVSSGSCVATPRACDNSGLSWCRVTNRGGSSVIAVIGRQAAVIDCVECGVSNSISHISPDLNPRFPSTPKNQQIEQRRPCFSRGGRYWLTRSYSYPMYPYRDDP
jgi:hypothetical protein